MATKNTDTPTEPLYPTCPHCGKTFMPGENFKTAAAAEAYAIEKCDCEEAKRDKNIKRIKRSIENLKAFCVRYNAILSDEIREALHGTAILIYDGIIDAVVIEFSAIKAKINRNTKGDIKLKFSYSTSASAEVEA